MKLIAFFIVIACIVYMARTMKGKPPRTKTRPKKTVVKKQTTFYEGSDYAASKTNEQLDLLPISPQSQTIPEHKRSSHLATENERRFHDALLLAIPSDYRIHCQVSLMALVQPVQWKDNSRTWAKRMDFVITDKQTQVLVVIELDDKTHNWKKRKARDEYVNKVLEGHHKLVRFKSARTYDPEHIKGMLGLCVTKEVEACPV